MKDVKRGEALVDKDSTNRAKEDYRKKENAENAETGEKLKRRKGKNR